MVERASFNCFKRNLEAAKRTLKSCALNCDAVYFAGRPNESKATFTIQHGRLFGEPPSKARMPHPPQRRSTSPLDPCMQPAVGSCADSRKKSKRMNTNFSAKRNGMSEHPL